jgi:hypothetical protein
MKIIMLTWVTLTWIAAALLLAQDKDTKPAKDADKKSSQDAGKSDPAKAAAAADPVASVIPKGATEVEPNLFRYTDPQGKTWLYRRFPFGVSKWEDKPAAQVAAEPPTAGVVRDLGDKVEFQRLTPFGMSKWISKKTDFNDDEKDLWAAYQAKRAAASQDTGKTGDATKTPSAADKNDKSAADKNKDKQEKE